MHSESAGIEAAVRTIVAQHHQDPSRLVQILRDLVAIHGFVRPEAITVGPRPSIATRRVRPGPPKSSEVSKTRDSERVVSPPPLQWPRAQAVAGLASTAKAGA